MSVPSPRPSGSSDRPRRDPRAGEAGGDLARADGTHGHPLVNTANPQTQQGPAPWPSSARAGRGPAVGAEGLRAEREAAGGLRTVCAPPRGPLQLSCGWRDDAPWGLARPHLRAPPGGLTPYMASDNWPSGSPAPRRPLLRDAPGSSSLS